MRISGLFSDNMILQRDKENLIYGNANPGDSVRVSVCFDSNDSIKKEDEESEWETSVTADSEGNFECKIAPFSVGGPYIISVISDGKDGLSEYSIKNVLFGDVYILGGQSNMELTIGMLPDENEYELSRANNDFIRMFAVPHEYDFSGVSRVLENDPWRSVNTNTISEFSAIGYYFAKEKYAEDGVPVGLIHTAVGGAPIEALMSKDNILKQAEYIRNNRKVEGGCIHDKHRGCIFCYEDLFKKESDIEGIKKVEESDMARVDAWHKDIDSRDLGLSEKWYEDIWEDADYKYNAPGFFVNTKYENWFGTLWLQKTFYVSEKHAGKEAKLSLGTLVDFDTAYVNGVEVGSTDYRYPQRRYAVPGGVIKPGKNTVTVRLGMDGNIGGFLPDMPYKISFEVDICGRGSCGGGNCITCSNTTCSGDVCTNSSKKNKEVIEVSLSGEWLIREGAKAERLDGLTYFIWYPSALYNSMISPLKGLSASAIMFYQGESNDNRAEYYDVLFKAMVEEWRNLLLTDMTPIYYAELAVYLGDAPSYEKDAFEAVREVQREVEPQIENAYLIKTTDLPAPYNELHPQNKKDLAHLFYEKFKMHQMN